MRRIILLTTLLAAFVGCAHTHLRQPLPNYMGHDAATLYVYRPDTQMGAALSQHVVLDGETLGVIGVGNAWEMHVKPGLHQVGTWEGSQQIDLEAGETVCFIVGPAWGGSTYMHKTDKCPPPVNLKTFDSQKRK